VLVNINNGCELQFADATPNVYGMKSTAGVLNIGSASVPAAISIASTGQVTIPDIISGSFVPIGGIVMWSGGVLPANWRICDGTAGTPDLRDRFIIGAGTFASGTSGGSTSITTLNLPSHNHSITDPGHSHNVVLTGMFNNGDNGSAIVYAGQSLTGTAGNRQSDPNAAQTNTTGIIVNNTGGGIAYYQPYYALAYIIRVA
jgi:microcystin-dependent protein